MFKYTAYINSLVAILLGLFVFIKGPTKKQNLLFFFLSLSIAMYAIFFALSIYNLDYYHSLLQVRIFHVFCLFLAAFIYLFANELVFSNTFKKIWHFIPFISTIVVSYYLIYGDVVKGVKSIGALPNWTVPGSQFFLYLFHFGLFSCLGLFLLTYYMFKTKGILKERIKLVLLAYLVGLGAGWTTFLPGWGIKIEPYGIHLIFISLFIIAYAIAKHQLMDISIIISRFVAELLTILLLGLIYVGLVLLYIKYVSHGIDILFLTWTIIYGVLIGQIHTKIRLFMQTTADKVFLRGKYDYYKELAEISSQITRTLSIENIIQILQKAFYEVIEVSNPRIYLQTDFNAPEVAPYLSIKELTFKGEELILPCMLENKQNAIIVLGKKLSEDPYTDEDLKMLSALANQTAVAIDCQRMYEEMLKAQEQLLMADKLTLLGEIAANLAKEIKPSLLRLQTLLDVRVGKKEDCLNNKEEITNEINYIDLLIEDILRPIRKAKT